MPCAQRGLHHSRPYVNDSLQINTLQRAFELHQRGQLAQAQQLYEQLLRAQPNHFDALHLMGVLASQTQRAGEALTLIDRALAIDAGGAVTHFNRATVLQQLERWREALESYDRAIEINPSFAEAFSNRSVVLTELGEYATALSSSERAIALKGGFAEAFFNRGNVLREMRRFEKAIASYDRAIELRRDYSEACYNRANALTALERWREAVAGFEQSIALRPRHVAAHVHRGHAEVELRQWQSALASYARAIEIEPTIRFVPGRLLYTSLRICDWHDFERRRDNVLERIAQGLAAAHPFEVLTLTDSAHLQLAATQTWVREKFTANRASAPSHPRHGRIRLGYFSGDFHQHAVAFLTAELFERHDRQRFEITAFSFGPHKRDAMRERLEAAFDRFIDVRERSDLEIVQLARRLEIDIAIDLGGYTEGARTEIFAARAAPLQLSYIGYLGTMGAPFIDYLIADPTLIPPAHRPHYAERILYLESYQANDTRRVIAERNFTRAELGLPREGIVFCCFNAVWKFNPVIFSSWMRILARVPRSVLFLFADHPLIEQNLRKEAAARGVVPERLVFGGRLPTADYLARYRAADLFLDTLPYGGGTTASDALWAGVPVLTCRGEALASRIAASLLTALDMPQLITDSLQDYEERAVELANDPERLSELRGLLGERRATARLFDIGAFTLDLERAYMSIYERQRSGLAPEDTR